METSHRHFTIATEMFLEKCFGSGDEKTAGAETNGVTVVELSFVRLVFVLCTSADGV